MENDKFKDLSQPKSKRILPFTVLPLHCGRVCEKYWTLEIVEWILSDRNYDPLDKHETKNVYKVKQFYQVNR